MDSSYFKHGPFAITEEFIFDEDKREILEKFSSDDRLVVKPISENIVLLNFKRPKLAPFFGLNTQRIWLRFTKEPSKLRINCEEHTKIPHAIYWLNNQGADPKAAMVFYTNDGKMILGLSIEDESREQEWLAKLKSFSQSDQGCILYESPPPDNSEEFLKLTKNR
jgi:hypothetical protein